MMAPEPASPLRFRLLLLLLFAAPCLAFSAPLPRAVIHVGPHKTATSYIQVSVCRHVSHLEQHGWVLPLCAQCGQQQCSPKAFANLAVQFANDTARWDCAVDAISCFRGALQQARTSGRHVFMSAEALRQLEGERLQLFAESLHGFNVSVAIYVRRALPMLLSRYHEVQAGFSNRQPESLAHYFLRIAQQQAVRREEFFHTGYRGLISRWAAAFGERALHLVSYEGVKAAGLDPFLVLIERVLGLPPVPNGSTPTVNSQPPSRVVAATAFLKHFVLMRSDEQLVVDFRCVRPWAESLLLPVLPTVCRPFAGWAAALNVREKVAATSTAPGAHRHCFEHEPEVGLLPEACEVDHPELFSRWGELLPRIKEAAAQAVAACPPRKVDKPL